MKKLLSILLTWLIALYNNVSYVTPAETSVYQPGMYYRLETGSTKPDYRSNKQITNQLDVKSVCLQSNYTAKQYDYSAESLRISKSEDDYAYWWQPNSSSHPFSLNSIDDSTQITIVSEGALIIAPSACRRTTAASTTQNYPVSMTLEMLRGKDTYVVNITGMHCWSCDAFKDLSNVEGVPVIVHSYADDGHNYSKGDVLGIAGENCTIQVWKKEGSNTQLTSWKEFYGVDIGG